MHVLHNETELSTSGSVYRFKKRKEIYNLNMYKCLNGIYGVVQLLDKQNTFSFSFLKVQHNP